MITSLKKYSDVCFDCPEFIIIHSAAGYETMERGDYYRSIPEFDALRKVNDYMAISTQNRIAAESVLEG